VLAFCTWLWGEKYTPAYVLRLYGGIRNHYKRPFRFLVMTERERKIEFPGHIERHAIKDPDLLNIPGCFARLRMFDVGWQKNRDLDNGIVCLDLDMVITGSIEDLFNRKEPLVVLAGANSLNPCPFNNSVFMFQHGAHPELWSDFSLDAVKTIKQYEFPDDQGWFWHKVPGAAVWKAGSSSGIYSFGKRSWPPGESLPAGAKIVAFPGARDPAMFTHLKWVKEHWFNVV